MHGAKIKRRRRKKNPNTKFLLQREMYSSPLIPQGVHKVLIRQPVAFRKNRFRNTETKDRTSTEDESYGLLWCETVVLYPITPVLEEPAVSIFYHKVREQHPSQSLPWESHINRISYSMSKLKFSFHPCIGVPTSLFPSVFATKTLNSFCICHFVPHATLWYNGMSFKRKI